MQVCRAARPRGLLRTAAARPSGNDRAPDRCNRSQRPGWTYCTARAPGLSALHQLEQLSYVLGWFHTRQHLRNVAVFIDDERCALHTHHLLAVQIPFLPHAISFRDFVIDVRQECEVEAELFLELLVGRDIVGTDAENN